VVEQRRWNSLAKGSIILVPPLGLQAGATQLGSSLAKGVVPKNIIVQLEIEMSEKQEIVACLSP
jgi:hypothetical protein